MHAPYRLSDILSVASATVLRNMAIMPAVLYARERSVPKKSGAGEEKKKSKKTWSGVT